MVRRSGFVSLTIMSVRGCHARKSSAGCLSGGGAGDDGCATAQRVVREGHQKWVPPSMRTSVPVMNLPSSEASMATTDATVSGPA